MTIRITGMNSGLDTESIIKELASARSMKVQNIEKEQTKLSWKIDAWKELNAKIYSLYTDVLSDMRYDYAYSKKTTKVSNPNVASVVASGNAVNGVQTMKISQLAQSSYLTGGAITKKAYALSGKAITGVPNHVTGGGVVKSTTLTGSSITKDGIAATKTLAELGLAKTADQTIKLSLTVDGKTEEIELEGSYSLETVAQKFAEKNLRASFTVDTNNKAGHFEISSIKDLTGLPSNKKYSAEFAISAISKTESNNDDAVAASAALLKGLGLDAQARTEKGNVNPSTTTLEQLGITGDANGKTKFMLKVGNNTAQPIEFDKTATLASVADAFKAQGLNAEFDTAKGRFVISAKDTNTTFTISALSAASDASAADKTAASNSAILLGKLGLDTKTQEKATGRTTLGTLGLTGDSYKLKVKSGITIGADKTESGGEEKTIEVNANDTLDDVAKKFRDAGVNAQFDATTGRFVLSATDTKTTFAVSALQETPEGTSAEKAVSKTVADNSVSLLGKLGLYDQDKKEGLSPSQGDIKDGTTKLKELGFGTDDTEVKFQLTIGTGADKKEEEVTFKGSQTLDDVAAMFRAKGLNAKFDAATKRFFISAKESGEANGFGITAKTITGERTDESGNKVPTWDDNPKALTVLQDLGLSYSKHYEDGDTVSAGQATMIKAQDAQVELNGAAFTFAKNTFEVNGLTITATQTTKEGESITLTTQQDTDGIYDTIKNFIKKYNEVINEMDKLYNAKSASKYDPLTKEEKDAMSEDEVKEWEKVIKESLLRRDTTLSSVSSVMKNAMSQTFLKGRAGVNDGRDIYLTYFGIETLGYFNAKDNEKNAYHIYGDKDDSSVKNKDDKLKKAIADDPDTVIEFFKSLANNLYKELDDKMARVEGYSSAFTVYNDKKMEEELKKYATKVETEQKKLNDYIDRWYSKFSKMEVAMSKLNSKQNSLSGLFGS